MKTRLAIVFGSRACEHDVSIISGLQALYAADAQKYDAFPVYISREGEWFVGDALRKMEFYKKPDWGAVRRVFPAGKHGKLALMDAQEHKGLFKKGEPDVMARGRHTVGHDGDVGHPLYLFRRIGFLGGHGQNCHEAIVPRMRFSHFGLAGRGAQPVV